MTNSEVIKAFNNLHGYANADTAFVQRLRLQDMTERQIAAVVIIVSTICLKCFDNPAPCDCENDE